MTYKYKAQIDAEYICSEAKIEGVDCEGEAAVRELKSKKTFRSYIEEISKCAVWDLDSNFIKDVVITAVDAGCEGPDVISAHIEFSFSCDKNIPDWESEEWDDYLYDIRNGIMFKIQVDEDFANFLINEGGHVEVTKA